MKICILSKFDQFPQNFFKLALNLRAHGHEDVEFLLVGDRKSPAHLGATCEDFSRHSYPCTYLDLQAQRALLSRHPELAHHLPYDCLERLNLGLLSAWLDASDLILQLAPEVQISDELDVLAAVKAAFNLPRASYHSASGWLNITSLLEVDAPSPFALRGFPFDPALHFPAAELLQESLPVAVHSGLIVRNPDLDAATRLEGTRLIHGLKATTPACFTLTPGTWSPLPLGCLAFRREVIPAYFLTPYAGRYSDIWAGYVVTRIAQHLSQTISFGHPLLHRDSPEGDVHRDYELELAGYRQTLAFCAALRSIPLAGTSFHDCFGEIAAALGAAWQETPRASGIEIEARKQFLAGMALWQQLFAEMIAEGPARLHQSIAMASPKASVSAVVGVKP